MDRRMALRVVGAVAADAIARRAGSGAMLFRGGQSETELSEAGTPYRPDWESLSSYKPPRWFSDAKFGIYFHWGLFSVPAFGAGEGHFGEFYPHNMYLTDTPEYKHQVTTYGPLDRFGYKDFAPMFRAQLWDPDAWISVFEDAGARYIGVVAEHADGFSMWNSRVNPFNAVNRGPKRDVVAEVKRAVRRRNLKFATTMHHHWLWGWYCSQDKNADIYNPGNACIYWPHDYAEKGAFNFLHPSPPPTKHFLDVWFQKVKEVVDGYEPDLLYFDSKLATIVPDEIRAEVVAHFYNQAQRAGHEVVLTYKHNDLPTGTAVFDIEAGQLKDKTAYVWQADDMLDWNSWGYVEHPDYKSSGRVLRQLVDIVSKNGNLLLDVGPRADGTLPDGVTTRLREIGAWLRLNGESIYGTRPWRTFGEGPTVLKYGTYVADHNTDFTARDIRFTTTRQALFVHVLGSPGSEVQIASINRDTPLDFGNLREITLLGTQQKLGWRWAASGLTVTLPQNRPSEEILVFRLSS